MKELKLLPTKKSVKRCAALITFVVLVYIYENFQSILHIDNSIYNYIIKPILWLIIAFLIFNFPNIRTRGRLRLRKLIKLWAFNFAIIYIIILVITGLFIESFGKSPYNHSIMGITVNIASITFILIGKENFRSYLTNSTANKGNHSIIFFVSLLMTILDISFKKYIELTGLQDTVQFIAQYFAPELCQNLFATNLAYLGGPVASVIYLGTIQAFYHFSPILPNMQWITTAFVGVMSPILFHMTMQKIYLLESKEGHLKKEDDSPLGWGATSILSIIIVWFAVGVFPVYPSVVVTGSMEPIIMTGDVILVKKIDDIESIKTGEIIQFKREGVLVSHRVIDIKEIGKVKAYHTKGDNNIGADTKWVNPQDVKGRIIQVVPKIGWPTMLMKSRNIKALDILLNKEEISISDDNSRESIMVQK